MLIEREFPHARRRLCPIAAMAVLLAASMIAHAQESVSAANGLMTFPNVRVVSAPPPAAAATSPDAAAQSGFRAFIDPATGKLTEPTREAVEELAAQERLRSLRPARPLPMFVFPNGAVRVTVGETFMSYAVARADAAGLAQACVDDETDALNFLAGRPLQATRAPRRDEVSQ